MCEIIAVDLLDAIRIPIPTHGFNYMDAFHWLIWALFVL
jgi:hypothetical protein